MKKLICILTILALFFSCGNDEEEDIVSPIGMDYKQEMRDFVIAISEYAKTTDPGFLIAPQNDLVLITTNGEDDENKNLPSNRTCHILHNSLF